MLLFTNFTIDGVHLPYDREGSMVKDIADHIIQETKANLPLDKENILAHAMRDADILHNEVVNAIIEQLEKDE